MNDWLNTTAHHRSKAANRAAAVREALASAGVGGKTAGLLIRAVALKYGVVEGTLRRWIKNGHDVTDCIDQHRSGRPSKVWDAPGAQQAWEYWLTDYLRLEKPTAIECLRRVQNIGRVQGWQLPSIKAFLRRLRKEIPIAVRVRGREGALAVMNLIPPQQRSVADLQPLDIINGDGKIHDLIVKLPSGKVGRPVVWYWQDIRTRRLLSWHAAESENAESVRLSLHDLIVNHGVPKEVLVDSTRAASNKIMTGQQQSRRRWGNAISKDKEAPGILKTLGIIYSHTIVNRDSVGIGHGSGQSKPIERAFADLAHYIDTHPLAAGAYTGKSTTDRPENHRHKPIEWETFLQIVTEGVAEYNARSGRQTEASAGRSHDESWAEEIAQSTIRRLSPEQASILLLAVESTKIKKDGSLTINAGRVPFMPPNRYTSMPLLDYVGKNLIVRYDPAKLHDAVFVYGTDGKYICRARCLLPVGFKNTSAAKACRKDRQDIRKFSEKMLSAITHKEKLLNALHQAPQPEKPPEAKPAALRMIPTPGTKPPVPYDDSNKKKFILGLKKNLINH